jgi:hypothetical protein
MARSERQVPDVYFGRPGALVTMPYPRGDMDRSFDKQISDFVTGSGQHVISSMMDGSRSYAVNWEVLHVDTYARIEPYWVGANGPGPFVFIDPSAPNLLPPNVASATSLRMDTTHLITSGGSNGTVSSNSVAANIHRTAGIRSIRWLWSVTAATNPVLGIQPLYRSWFAHPVAPSLPYTFSSWVKPDGVVDISITVAMKLEWQDSTGTIIGSQISGGDTVVTAWQRLSVSGTSPSNAAFVRPIWVVTGSTVTTGGSLYIDEPLLEQDSVLNTWAPGTGIRPVEIVGLNDEVPFAARFRQSLALNLRELIA